MLPLLALTSFLHKTLQQKWLLFIKQGPGAVPSGFRPTKPDVTLAPHRLSLAQFATFCQLDICNTNRRNVSTSPTISQLLLLYQGCGKKQANPFKLELKMEE